MAIDVASELEKIQKSAEALPDVIELAQWYISNTTKWAEENGLLSVDPKTVSQNAIDVGKRFDEWVGNQGSFNSNQVVALLGFATVLIGEKIPSQHATEPEKQLDFVVGTVIAMKANMVRHAYPLGEPIFVIDNEECRGVMSNGTVPPVGYHFDPVKDSIQFLSNEQVVAALAKMYVLNRPQFDTLKEISVAAA